MIIYLIQHFKADFLWKVSLKCPELKINPENFHPCLRARKLKTQRQTMRPYITLADETHFFPIYIHNICLWRNKNYILESSFVQGISFHKSIVNSG